MKKAVYTTFEISHLLQVNPTTVQNWARRGMLPFYTTPGGHRRVRLEDLLEFIRNYNFPIPKELADHKRRLLIVDGEAAAAKSMRQAILRLASDEWEVATVQNAIDALLAIGELKPEIVLLDLALPDLNGMKICRHIKERSPRTRIISVSRKPEEALAPRSLEVGVDKLLIKPLTAAKLLPIMRRLVLPKGGRS